MRHTPFYDPFKSYVKNYVEGPFGAFADGKTHKQPGTPRHTYLGHKVHLPFGIPAGPLLNSAFIKAAFEKGFDVCVYKTVRTSVFPSHPYPNVLAIHKKKLFLEDMNRPLRTTRDFSENLSITNSLGVPSKDPSMWQEDVTRALSYAKKGQVVVVSFMGTARRGQTEKDFIADYVCAAKLAYETKAPILEVNLSCPNIGNSGLVCYNTDVTERILKGIRKVIGTTPLNIKVGYFQHQAALEGIAEIANEYADSIAVINTLQATVTKEKGKQALPGTHRLRSGVCGPAIKWAGIDMVARLKEIRERKKYTFAIEGVGGVVNAHDYLDYKNAGADSVMSATGAMWNPFLAQEIKQGL